MNQFSPRPKLRPPTAQTSRVIFPFSPGIIPTTTALPTKRKMMLRAMVSLFMIPCLFRRLEVLSLLGIDVIEGRNADESHKNASHQPECQERQTENQRLDSVYERNHTDRPNEGN
jgi:hypothetical protein